MRLIAFLFMGCVAFAQQPTKIDFEKSVLPILEKNCFSCHGLEVQQSGLRLDRRQPAMRGGDYGPVIVAGKAEQSRLYRRVLNGDGGLQMPPTGALSSSDIETLRLWIDQGADWRIEVGEEPAPKPIDPKIEALISAVRSTSTQKVQQLLAADPDLIRARDTAGNTLLHHAAGFGTMETLKLLLAKGADVNAGNRRKSTPLTWAMHDLARVQLLLEKGAYVNAQTVDGRTPLFIAASRANSESLVRLLLSKGANPALATLDGTTPLMMAAARDNAASIRLLLDVKADVNARDSSGSSALFDACMTGGTESVRLLLERGANANFKTKKNETALALAATTGNEEIVRMLIDKGADVNVADIRGYSALVYAGGSDALPSGVVKLLLAKGADVTAKGDGQTAAQHAAKRGDTDVARLLGVSERDRVSVPTFARRSSISQAIAPAFALLAKQSTNFIRIAGCNSCHAQDLPSAAAGLANDRGLPAPKAIEQLPDRLQPNTPERLMDLNTIALAGVNWELFDLGMNHAPRSWRTDAAVRYIASQQSADGHWRVNENRRPPMNQGMFQGTALAVYAIQQFGRLEDKAANADSVARAAAWLEANPPRTVHDMAYRLLGLRWSNASAAAISSAVKQLSAAQRSDGGWSQLTTLDSDAYATGLALYALAAGGVAPSSRVYKQGVDYLLGTQAADGSWYVRSRSIWIQPYFESGFPYGYDQFISAAGTSWAVMALSMAEPTKLTRARASAR